MSCLEQSSKARVARCKGKVAYHGEFEADLVVQAAFINRRVILRRYHCDVCRRWHVTSQVTNTKALRKVRSERDAALARIAELEGLVERYEEALKHILSFGRCSTGWSSNEAAIKSHCHVCVARAALAGEGAE